MRRTIPFRPVAVLLGLVLVTAGCLKAYQLRENGSDPGGLLSSPWLRLAAVELEWGLGLWLLSGLSPRAARWAALACFVTFWGVVLHRAVAGERSCGCFGAVDLAPWAALLFDALAVSALLASRPVGERSAGTGRPLLRVVAAAALFLSMNIPVALALRASGMPALTPSTRVLDLGEVTAGGRREETVRLSNLGATTVEVKQLQASCPCLEVLLDRDVVPPAGTAVARVVLDLESEPTFTGDLAIEVRGRTGAGDVTFALRVKARVRQRQP